MSGTTRREPKLLDKMRGAMRVRQMGRRTEKAYVGWARRYILFHGKRHPAEMREDEVTAFLTHLARERKVSASTQSPREAECLTLESSSWLL